MLQSSIKRCLIFGMLVATGSILCDCRVALSADESIDALLNEANRALGRPAQESRPANSNADDSAKPSSPKRLRSTKQKSSSLSPANSNAKDASADGKEIPAGSQDKPDDGALKPLDVKGVTEILALDLQAQERERITRARGLSVRVGYAHDRIPAVYEVEKDDDTFRISETAGLNGGAIEAIAQVPIHSLGRDLGYDGAPFWGIVAGAGLLQGDVQITRRGVFKEDRSYPYQVIATDGGITAGWSSNLGKSSSSGYQLWLTAGYGADVVRQIGDGQYDTFTEVFHGQVIGLGASWRTKSNYEFYLQLKQRGRLSSGSNEPTRSRIAGRMVMIGLGVPFSG